MHRAARVLKMEMAKDGGTPTHQNTLALDLAATQWFSENVMTTVFIRTRYLSAPVVVTCHSASASGISAGE